MNIGTIIQFVERFQSHNSNRQFKFIIGDIGEEEAAGLLALTSIDVSGFVRIVDNFGVRHAFKKHGHPATEEPRGQIAISPNDFEFIQSVALSATVIIAEIGKKGLIVVRYEKKIDDFLLVYAEGIRVGQKELAFQTLYKRKIRKP